MLCEKGQLLAAHVPTGDDGCCRADQFRTDLWFWPRRVEYVERFHLLGALGAASRRRWRDRQVELRRPISARILSRPRAVPGADEILWLR